MAKRKESTKDPPEKKGGTKGPPETPSEIELKYNLYDLPSAQHKAGLAGLLLMIESMKRRKMKDVPKIASLSSTEAVIQVDPRSLQALFDDYYDAQKVEVSSKTKWQGQDPLREEEVEIELAEGRKKKEKRFVYRATQPKAAFLAALNGGSEPWLKLYRDMLWSTLRSRPTTRGIYDTRAEGAPAGEAGLTWKLLVKCNAPERAGKMPVASISSAIFIGAQDTNAEQVPFQGTAEQNLLLHFWPVAARIFAPFKVDVKGDSVDAGYVFAIPEPSDLRDFLDDYLDVLGSLDATLQGYRPRQARIDVPAEGGLEYLGAMARRRVAKGATGFSLTCVEVIHLEKQGNNVRMHSAQRIQPSLDALEQYDVIKQSFWNPLFRGVRLSNLLDGRRWYAGFDSLMALWPQKFFVYKQGETPAHLSFFGNDARRAFSLLRENSPKQGELPMDTETRENALALRVHDLVRSYVNRRTEDKCGISYDAFKDKRDERGNVIMPQAYREAREKVCTDAFLAIRGRNDGDFLEYFAGTICSVPQYLNRDDFLAVTQALFEDWEKVKTISMLALSAASWTSKNTDNSNGNQ